MTVVGAQSRLSIIEPLCSMGRKQPPIRDDHCQPTTRLGYYLSMDVERNNDVVRKRALGATKPSIAREMGVSLSIVEFVLRQNHSCITHLAPPAGISMRTAL